MKNKKLNKDEVLHSIDLMLKINIGISLLFVGFYALAARDFKDLSAQISFIAYPFIVGIVDLCLIKYCKKNISNFQSVDDISSECSLNTVVNVMMNSAMKSLLYPVIYLPLFSTICGLNICWNSSKLFHNKFCAVAAMISLTVFGLSVLYEHHVIRALFKKK